MGTAHVLFTDQNSELPSIINFLSLEVCMVAWMRGQFFWDMMLSMGEQFPMFQRNIVPPGLRI
jgi:hypothetical protein